MGRWGYRLFEGDIDIDIALEFNTALGKGKKEIKLSRMVHQTDMLAPPEALAYYKTDAYKKELDELVKKNREKLDTGIGDKLMEMYRSKEKRPYNEPDESELKVILLGALLMRAGAKIKDGDIQHLRKIANGFPGKEGFQWPLSDDDLRGPGKAQLLAALDNYKPGTPRNYQEPSCFKCGKVEVDLGKAPSKCARCQRAWYCDKDCQKAHWKGHKSVCIPPAQRRSLNV